MKNIILISIVLLLIFWVLFFVLLKTKENKYSSLEWKNKIEDDFKKYGPVSEYYEKGRLKIALITPTERLFNKFLNKEVEKDNHFMYHRVSDLKDLDNIDFFRIVYGYSAISVPLEVCRRTHIKLNK